MDFDRANFELSPAQVDRLTAEAPARRASRKSRDPFIPPIRVVWFAKARAVKADDVAVLLAYRAGLLRSDKGVRWGVADRELFGIPERTVRRQLARLAAAGLIVLHERGPGRKTEVDLVGWRPVAPISRRPKSAGT